MGESIAFIINTFNLLVACSYIGLNFFTFQAAIVKSFSDGIHQRPAHMEFRPQWQNLGQDKPTEESTKEEEGKGSDTTESDD